MAGEIHLVGMDKLVVKLRDNMKKEAVKTVVKKNGSRLQQVAMQEAPVDTGTLKRSITLEITDGGMTAESEATAHYAGYQEYGTRFMTAQPFMHPAVREVGPKFQADMEKLVK